MKELEERRKNTLDNENKKAKQGQRDFLERERAAQRRNTEDSKAANEEIVAKLFSLEVKLNKSQQKHLKTTNDRKGKALNFNLRVERTRENNASAPPEKQRDTITLNKIVEKQRKITEFSKLKNEDSEYNSHLRQQIKLKADQKLE